MTIFRSAGRLARGPWHQVRNILDRWLQQDLRQVVMRRNGQPVRLLVVRLLETFNVCVQAGALSIFLAILAPLAILAIGVFFVAQQMRDVWEPLP